MRYQNWDVLVFPDQSKIPLQEFKTACQVIQDQGTQPTAHGHHILTASRNPFLAGQHTSASNCYLFHPRSSC
jgi:hypothetical protein